MDPEHQITFLKRPLIEIEEKFKLTHQFYFQK